MTDFQRRFIVDTNGLIRLGHVRRASAWFHEHCQIPTEVLYEARDLPDIQSLKSLEYTTTPSVLEQVSQVMASVSQDDTSLVDLFTNRGNGDPFVVACALDGRAQEESALVAFEWTVVSNDAAVHKKAMDFDLSCLQPDELMAIWDRDKKAAPPRTTEPRTP